MPERFAVENGFAQLRLPSRGEDDLGFRNIGGHSAGLAKIQARFAKLGPIEFPANRVIAFFQHQDLRKRREAVDDEEVREGDGRIGAAQDEDSREYLVVVNEQEQYSIWPADLAVPGGWRDGGARGTKQDCLAHVDQVWTDMRPLSLRQAS